jgi:hypothetical protein
MLWMIFLKTAKQTGHCLRATQLGQERTASAAKIHVFVIETLFYPGERFRPLQEYEQLESVAFDFRFRTAREFIEAFDRISGFHQERNFSFLFLLPLPGTWRRQVTSRPPYRL